MTLIYLFLMILFIPPIAHSQTTPLQNINISASLDLLVPLSFDKTEDNKLSVRSTELLIFAPIDPFFDGVINLAGHNDEGEFKFDLHEGYIASTKIIPQSRFRIGQFFLDIGRLNKFHRHDWPFVSAPKVQREFLSPGSHSANEAEGASDTGLEFTWNLPTDRFIDFTLGVTNGYCFGHCHEEGEKPPYPVHYIHPTIFFDFSGQRGLLVGVNYLGRKDSANTKTELYGLDFTFKNRQGRRLKWFVQSEVFYQVQSSEEAVRSEKLGLYVYPQYGFNDQMSFGMRVDGFSHLNMKFPLTGQSRDDLDYAFVPTMTYKTSEFSTLRLAYSHEVDTTQGVKDVYYRQILLQLMYILGAHPTHDF